MIQKKRMIDKVVEKEFFCERDFSICYMNILSYIPNNKDCFSFATTSKSMWKCFSMMLRRSSSRFYRLSRMNGQDIGDVSFSLFSDTGMEFDLSKVSDYYVQNVEDFDKNFRNEKMFEIMGKINEKYGNVCMVSGSFALKNLLKSKNFPDYATQVGLEENNPDDGDPQWHRNRKDLSNKSPQDIDIFLLGPKKKEVFGELIKMMSTEMENHSIRNCHGGLYDIYEKKFNDGTGGFIRRQRGYLGTGKWDKPPRSTDRVPHPKYQIILKNLHQCASDVFAFFDLDCCKVGYFPGKRRVVTCASFVRSLFSRINYLDLHINRAGWKHYHRILKYFDRTRIRTDCRPEPLLSFYHTFLQGHDKRQRELYVWDAQWPYQKFKLGKTNDRNTDLYGYYQGLYYSNYKSIENERVDLKEFHRSFSEKTPLGESRELLGLGNPLRYVSRPVFLENFTPGIVLVHLVDQGSKWSSRGTMGGISKHIGPAPQALYEGDDWEGWDEDSGEDLIPQMCPVPAKNVVVCSMQCLERPWNQPNKSGPPKFDKSRFVTGLTQLKRECQKNKYTRIHFDRPHPSVQTDLKYLREKIAIIFSGFDVIFHDRNYNDSKQEYKEKISLPTTNSFDLQKSAFDVEVEVEEIPYVVTSVGIVKKDGKFVYDERKDADQMVTDKILKKVVIFGPKKKESEKKKKGWGWW